MPHFIDLPAGLPPAAIRATEWEVARARLAAQSCDRLSPRPTSGLLAGKGGNSI
jgi:hypothetical protein